jgi:hypothetical protein
VKWLNVAGLIFELLGATVITFGVIASRKHVEQVTQMIVGYNPAERADRRRQSNLALVGLGLLSVGFVLQIIATLPRP